MSGFNWVDYTVLSIFFASIVAGLMRGLVKEVISVLTWCAAAIVATLFSSPMAASFTSSQSVQSAITNASSSVGINATHPVSLFAIGVSFVILFVGTLILGSIINYLLSRAVEGQGISVANRLLGALFGGVRGFLINLILLFLIQLSPLAQQPFWAQSQFVQSFQPAVEWLANTVQPGIDELKQKVGDTLQGVGSQVQGTITNFTQ